MAADHQGLGGADAGAEDVEGLEVRLEVRLAQHDGSIRANQQAIDKFALRLDSLEAKQQEAARGQEESLRARLEAFEKRLEQSLLAAKAAAEEGGKRLERFERRTEEHFGDGGLDDRLHAVEAAADSHHDRLTKLSAQVAVAGAGTQVAGQGGGEAAAQDRKVKELAAKVDRAMREALAVHSTIKEHEVHMSALQQRVDGPGGLLERTSRAESVDAEGLVERTRQMVRDENALRATELEIFRKRMDELDSRQRDLAADVLEAVRGEYDKLMLGLSDIGGGDDGAATNGVAADESPAPPHAAAATRSSAFEASPALGGDLDSLPRGRAVGYHAAMRREAARAADAAIKRLRRELAESLHDCRHVPELRQQVSELLLAGGRGQGGAQGEVADGRGRTLSDRLDNTERRMQVLLADDAPRGADGADVSSVKARLSECERLLQEMKAPSRRPSKDFGPQRSDSGSLRAPKMSPSASPPSTARDDAAHAVGHVVSDGTRISASRRRISSIEVMSGQQGREEGDILRILSGMSHGSECSGRQLHMRDSGAHAPTEPEEFKREMMGLCESLNFCHSETETEESDDSVAGFGDSGDSA